MDGAARRAESLTRLTRQIPPAPMEAAVRAASSVPTARHAARAPIRDGPATRCAAGTSHPFRRPGTTRPGRAETAPAKPASCASRTSRRLKVLSPAERIGEFLACASERSLQNRASHFHFTQRNRARDIGQHGIGHRGAGNRRARIVRELEDIRPVHRDIARHRFQINTVTVAKVGDGGGQFIGRQCQHPRIQHIEHLDFLLGRVGAKAALLTFHEKNNARRARHHHLQRQPPGLRDVVDEAGRHIERERHPRSVATPDRRVS